MKLHIEENPLVNEGVRYNNGDFVFDYTYNMPDDIIDIVPPQLYRTTINNKVYWFGYKFKDKVTSKQRTEFIEYIKGTGKKKISDSELRKFIELPLGELDKKINIYTLDCLVCPGSKRSDLVKKMITSINGYTSHETNRCTFELVKSVPTKIEFDWKMFENDTKNDKNKHNQMLNHINNVIMPAIKNLDYFSLATNVKTKYRKYIKNYLNFSPEDLERFSELQADTILVIDDINTTGSTLEEILRILNKINNNCKIFIYTLIGKDSSY